MVNAVAMAGAPVKTDRRVLNFVMSIVSALQSPVIVYLVA